MENKELNSRILKNVRNKIVISNLEREENMKLNIRKQIITLGIVLLLVLSGGFITTNAATNGKLVEGIKDNIKVRFIKEGKEELLNGKMKINSDENSITIELKEDIEDKNKDSNETKEKADSKITDTEIEVEVEKDK